jgi:selenocysteine lyase/cysteine desulfurase
MYVGLPWVVERTGQLAERLRGGLIAVDGVELEGDPAGRSALLAFRIPGWRADEAAAELSHRSHAIIDPEPDGDLLRVSVGAWNTEEELDRFVERVAELAGSTPETLPRRPSLTIIAGPLADLDA